MTAAQPREKRRAGATWGTAGRAAPHAMTIIRNNAMMKRLKLTPYKLNATCAMLTSKPCCWLHNGVCAML
jgi:hypothetical protein